MNANILNTALLNGIDVTVINVEDNTVTELKAIHNTPYADTLDIAYEILDATLAEYGATYFHDPVAGWLPYKGDGYAVGGYQDTVTVRVPEDGVWERVAQTAIARFIERIPTDLAGRRKYSLGTWVDDGTLHIDAVIVWADLENAIVEGQRLDQHSVYGFREGREYVCADYEVVDGEVFEKATGRNVLNEVELEPIDQLVEDEGHPPVIEFDVLITSLENQAASFRRLAEDFRKTANDPNEDYNQREGSRLNADRFGVYADCLDWQIIPAIKSQFGK